MSELQRIADYYGESKQSIQLIEEMSELTKALTKYLRFKEQGQAFSKLISEDEILKNITEEIADVEILLEQIQYLFNIDDANIDNIKQFKINRTIGLLKDESNSNREILFRAKTEDGIWVYGYLVVRKGINIETAYIACPDGSEFVVKYNTVGQYTGLKDKNGKKIFEGDIIKETAADELFDDSLLAVEGVTTFGFDFRYIANDTYTTALDIGISDDNTYLTSVEVVGNIYDNPGLLQR